jgi:hypothetical protein
MQPSSGLNLSGCVGLHDFTPTTMPTSKQKNPHVDGNEVQVMCLTPKKTACFFAYSAFVHMTTQNELAGIILTFSWLSPAL